MVFGTLKDKCLYYRSLTDYKLIPNSYVICMLDGRSFSKIIKNKFKKPFDETFAQMMNDVAVYLCQNVYGCKLAYVQSDEITLILTDFEKPNIDSMFKYRLCKLQSIIASMAAGKFNQLWLKNKLELVWTNDNIQMDYVLDVVNAQKLVEFDCKCWNVPSFNDVFAWLLYRQNECIRNSKSQFAQTYISHKSLQGLTSDEQIELVEKEKNLVWNEINDAFKFGRHIYKEEEEYYDEERDIKYLRNSFKVHNAVELKNAEERERFMSLDIIPKIS